MPDKFENATLLLRLGLPSTLQRTYPHKKICENGTFWIRSLERNNLKTQLFCISVDRELFVSGTFWIRLRHFVMWFIFPNLSRSEIQHGGQHDVFCVVVSNFFLNRLFRMSRRNLSYLWHYLFAFYPVTSQVSRNLTKQGERNEILVNSWQ